MPFGWEPIPYLLAIALIRNDTPQIISTRFLIQEPFCKIPVYSTGEVRNFAEQVGYFGKEVGNLGEQVGYFGREVGNLGEQVGYFGKEVGNLGEQVGYFGREVGNLGEQVDNLFT